MVNSAHPQAADRLGQGLRAVQWAIDGTVEAVIHQSLPGVGCPVAPGAAGPAPYPCPEPQMEGAFSPPGWRWLVAQDNLRKKLRVSA